MADWLYNRVNTYTHMENNENNAESNISPKSKKTTLIVLITSVTLLVIILVVFLAIQYKKPFSIIQDLDAPVARVNNVEVSRKSFNLAMSGLANSTQLSKVDTTKNDIQNKMRTEALNAVIEAELVVQKAKEMNIAVSPIEVDNEIRLIESELGGHAEFLTLLNKIGITEQDMRNDIERQLLITAYENKIYDKSKDVITETDIKMFYEALRDKYLEQGSIAPDLEIVREKVKEKILERRQQIRLEEEAAKLKTTAKIEILI